MKYSNKMCLLLKGNEKIALAIVFKKKRKKCFYWTAQYRTKNYIILCTLNDYTRLNVEVFFFSIHKSYTCVWMVKNVNITRIHRTKPNFYIIRNKQTNKFFKYSYLSGIYIIWMEFCCCIYWVHLCKVLSRL